MNAERDERMFAKMEQQIAKQEISLRGMGERERTWFQTMKHRKSEKERLDNNFKAAEAAKNAPNDLKRKADGDLSHLSESKRKKKEEALKKANKTPSQLAKEKYKEKIEKASLLRAKASKQQHKPKRIRQLDDNIAKKSFKNKKESRFAIDLTNTSRRNTKKLR